MTGNLSGRRRPSLRPYLLHEVHDRGSVQDIFRVQPGGNRLLQKLVALRVGVAQGQVERVPHRSRFSRPASGCIAVYMIKL